MIVRFIFPLILCASSLAAVERPNVIIIFMDDMGYADAGCYGAKGFKTPEMDTMSREGMRLTDFYVAASVCTPSRAALLTGCYPKRVSITGVFFPDRGKNKSLRGLNPKETTIAKMLKKAGYSTSMVGKWHLGDKKMFLPLQHGFDEFFGLPYSNDMIKGRMGCPELPLLEGNETIEVEPDQRYLTKRYTERAVAYIKKSKDKPFFLYLAHTMPHVPLFASETFKGKTKRGIYGDVMEELDWSVGQVMKTLKETGIDEKTLVILTSDNGPWLEKRSRGGKADPLRGGKFTNYEGGLRVPCILRWPGTIKPRESSDIVAAIDLLPTIATLSGAPLPKETIDGLDMSEFLLQGKPSPRTTFFYGHKAVRQGNWKLILGKKSKNSPAIQLYNLETDIGESKNIADENPKVVKSLTALLKSHNATLSKEARSIGRVPRTKNEHKPSRRERE